MQRIVSLLQDAAAFLMRNKVKLGGVFGAIATWGAVQGCSPIVGVDVLAYLHLSCAQVNAITGLVSAFFFGAGGMTSDKHESVIQGVRPPTGPPPTIVQGPGYRPPAPRP